MVTFFIKMINEIFFIYLYYSGDFYSCSKKSIVTKSGFT